MKLIIPSVCALCLVAYVSCAYESGGERLEGSPSISRSQEALIPRAESKKKQALKINITESFIPKGKAGRWRVRPMRPKYITIHSTQNRSRGAGAEMHARALRNGSLKSTHNSLKFLTWHYTVDDHSIYQHLPDNEQGQHADYEGEGNRSSIGIEICENIDSSREQSADRAARLAAYLMKKHQIPLSGIKAHYHWERIRYDDGKNLGHKNCPHFLLTNGKPGAKWDAYVQKIKSYYDQL